MNSNLKQMWWCGAAMLLLAWPALAESRAAQAIVIGQREVVSEDLYAVGNTVRVEGTVDGDLVTAAGTVEIPGHVTGDVLTAAGTVIVTGKVDGSVRALGGQLELDGPVGEDVLAATGRFTVGPTGGVGRDVVVSAGNAELRAPVGGEVRMSAGTLVLAAPVAGNADVTVQALKVEDGAELANTLKYRSPTEAEISPGAQLMSVERLKVEGPSAAAQVAGFFFTWARAFFAFSLLGLLLALASPRFARLVPEVLKEAPWKSLGWGALVLLAAPFAAAALFVAGVLLGGWWLGLIASGVVLSAMALSFPVVGYQLGRYVVAKTSATHARRFGALLLGVAAVTLVMRIPLLGALVALAVMLFGLGSMLLAGVRLRKGTPGAI